MWNHTCIGECMDALTYMIRKNNLTDEQKHPLNFYLTKLSHRTLM